MKIRHTSLVVVALAVATVAIGPGATGQVVAPPPTVTDFRIVTGTKAMMSAGTGVANLDAGNLVAGMTKWDKHNVGIFFNETFVAFLWEPTNGSVVVRENSDNLFFEPHFSVASEITPGRTIVGTDGFRQTRKSYGWVWNPTDGLLFLPTQCNGPAPPVGEIPSSDCTSGALAISDDAKIVAGAVRDDYTSPPQAARWILKRTKRGLRATLDVLPPRTAGWSEANDVSPDGAVVVGNSGPSDVNFQAARWTDGAFQALQAVGDNSTALFVSTDGRSAIGTANDGATTVLVRWAADGTATRFDPPAGSTIASVRAINPDATAAVGALSFDNNWAPFLWTEAGGYTVLPELDQPLYDFSEAVDVSDDGTVVVGALQASVISNGFPPSYAFYWSERTGLVLINDIVAGLQPDTPDYYSAGAISGDGLRLLVTGNPPAGPHDTNSVLLTLAPQ